MNLRPQPVFWVTTGVVFFGLLFLLRDILLPFVLGAAIAYMLDPLADRLGRLGFSRFWATMLIVSLFAIMMALFLLGLVPLIFDQLTKLMQQLPEYYKSLRDIVVIFAEKHFSGWMSETDMGFEKALEEIVQAARGWVGTLLKTIWSGGLALVNFLALILVTPVVAFYLLLDWDRMIGFVDSWVPRDHTDTVRGLARQIDDVISGFVRGQFTVLVLLSIFYVVGLTLIGLKFALLLGLAIGLISIIPYVGPVVGFIIGGIVAVAQFWPDWAPVAGVLGIFIAGQVIEGNVLSPLIVGERVGLHPVWLIFALFVFAFLFGFLGMLIAVPVAAAIGVLVRFGLHRYLASPLYHGSAEEEAGPEAG